MDDVTKGGPASVPVSVFRDPRLVARVVETLRDAAGDGWCADLHGAAIEEWSMALDAVGVAAAAGPVVVVATAPDVTSQPDAAVAAWVAEVTGRASMVVLATRTPASAAVGEVTRWPSGWAAAFSVHGWRFVDVVRPAIWDDGRFGPDAKEGWLVFVAPACWPELRATPATAMVHPDRLGAAVAGVRAELEQLRRDFLDGAQALAHRSELETVRRRVAATTGAVEDLQVRQAALAARLASTERLTMLMMERQLRETAAPLPVVPTAGSRRLASVRRVLGRRPAADVPAATRAYSPAVVALFDAAAYARDHPEAADDALGHYLSIGEQLGYRPNPWFDPLFYLERYPDVRGAGVSAFVHFVDFGGAEGRAASEQFNTEWYVQAYPEVRLSGLNPMLHFVAVGATLGYRPTPGAVDGPPAPPAGR